MLYSCVFAPESFLGDVSPLCVSQGAIWSFSEVSYDGMPVTT